MMSWILFIMFSGFAENAYATSEDMDLEQQIIKSEQSNASEQIIEDVQIVESEQCIESQQISYEMDVELSEKQDTFDIVFRGDVEEKISQLKVAVWSKVNDQDDLLWYLAERKEDNTWKTSGTICNHGNSTGLYYFHAYGVCDGVNQFLTAQKVTVEGISNSDELIVDKNQKEGKIRINTGSIVSPAGIKEVNIAVWSDKNGQDDLKWYSGILNNDNQWYTEIDCAFHGYDTGVYIIHVYVRDNRGVHTYLTGIRTEIYYDYSNSLLEATTNDSYTEMEMVLKNIELAANSRLEVAVWSDVNGQDDLKWYALSKDGMDWKNSFRISNHKNSLGIYHMHVYLKTKSGMQYITGSSMQIKGVSAEEIKVLSCDREKGFMEMQVVGVGTITEIVSMEIAVWNVKDGQNDLHWYEAKEEDKWIVRIPLKNHQFEYGTYNIHAYAIDARGINQCIKTFNYQYQIDMTIDASVSELQDKIEVTIETEKIPVGIQTIKFAVWSEVNGQDDLRWYEFKESNTKNVYIDAHKHSIGTYIIHVYVKTNAGSEVYVTGKRVEIQGNSCDGVKVTEYDEEKGTFHIAVENVMSPGTINEVRFAVWTKNKGQDDLVIYRGNSTDDLWSVEVDTYNHNYESGIYYIHVYAVDSRKVDNFIGGIEYEFQQDLKNVSLDIVNNTSNNTFDATLSHGKIGKNIVEVQFAVWSNVNGQDDLKWYKAEQIMDNQWSKTIQIGNHKNNSGIYHIHAYGIDKKGERYCLKTNQSIIMYNFQPSIITKEFEIEGISKEYQFLLISDSHVIVVNEKDSTDEKELGTSRIKYFINKNGMTSEEQFPYWINYANEHKMDGFLLLGDIIDYPSKNNVDYLKENLNNVNSSYVYALGNHDWVYPWNESTEEYRYLFEEITGSLSGNYYVEYEELVMLAIDDSTYQVNENAVQVTEEAFAIGKPVVLMMHIPLQTDSLLEKSLNGWKEALVIGPDGHQPNEITQQFIDKVLAENSPVRLILSGHVHMEDVSMVNDRITQYVANISATSSGVKLHINNKS